MIKVATLADKRAIEAEMPVAAALAAPARSTSSSPRRPAASRSAARSAFQLTAGPGDKAVTLTWAEFIAEVTRAANLFRRLGIGPGDTVACVLPNGSRRRWRSSPARPRGSSTRSTRCSRPSTWPASCARPAPRWW